MGKGGKEREDDEGGVWLGKKKENANSWKYDNEWSEEAALNNAERSGLLRKNQIEKVSDVGVVLQVDIEGMEEQTVYPYDNLMYVANIDSKLEETGWPKQFRLEKIKNMVEAGFDVEMLGIKTFKDKEENVFYSKSFEVLDLELIKGLVKELIELENKPDFSDASDDLRKFLGDNFDKVEAEYSNIKAWIKVDDGYQEIPEWLEDEEEDNNVDKTDWPSWLKDDVEEEEDVELEEKNSLPTEMQSTLEDVEKGKVSVTHVLALDIIQRIHYSKEGEKARIPVVENGKIVRWEELDIRIDLLAEDKGGEVFKALARHFWKDLAIHGILKEGKDGENSVLLEMSDLDGEICKYLFKMAGIDTKNVSYRNHNDDKEGAVHADMGNKDGVYFHIVIKDGVVYVTTYLDHHDPKSKSDMSASGWVFSGLSKLGLIENPERHLNMVSFINKKDNGLPPMEMEEVVEKYKKETGKVITRREFVLQKLYQTAWGLKQYIKAPNFIEFFKNGGDPLKILGDKDLWKLGVKYNPDKKRAPEKEVNKQVVFKANLENSLMELQIAENEEHVFESEKYGKILVDVGRKMGGLGNELSRACGYDGFLSWDPDKNSFMLTTKKNLEVRFGMGINVREHMWIKKPEMEGVVEGDGYKEILKMLNGGVEGKWTNGLQNEAVEIKGGNTKRQPEEEKKALVWDDEVIKDLDEATRGKETTEENRLAWQRLEARGFFLLKSNEKKDKEFFEAIDICTGQVKGNKERAVEFLKDYFGVESGGNGKVEKKTKKDDPEKLTIDDERSKEEYFVELRKMATTEEWNRAIREISGYQEPQKSYAFGFMKVAYDWYMHPEKIMQTKDGLRSWKSTYEPILNKLGIKTDE